ncbi:MAG: phosphoenolpyruvate synthase [Candidatus Liptonbacteria bacterium]|nr:phosphoenolpyruvate synthase [Candidatus Liptonbacteria bacterium]
MISKKLVIPLDKVTLRDVPSVGGKNASLGELLHDLAPQGVRIPGGFAVTAEAYRFFLQETGLDRTIRRTLKGLNVHDLADLARRGLSVREAIRGTELPKPLAQAIRRSYAQMERHYGRKVDVAVRSSATAEDLPGASFAGEHETFLNMRGAEEVLAAVRAAMASLFTNRAISYRVDKGFDHFKVALSVGVQKMVRSDLGCSGVMFTLDTESGFKDVVLINGAWGLGELIVQGEVTPDEFLVFKPTLADGRHALISKRLGVKNRKFVYNSNRGLHSIKLAKTSPRELGTFVLTENEVLTLARWGAAIEKHYSARAKRWTPMDIEWAKDGRTGELFIVQARPETIHAGRDYAKVRQYTRTQDAPVLVRGAAVGSAIASGTARVILDAKHIREFKPGEALVTTMTDPDWEPIMKIAAAIVTNKGGRTSHAAIVSRELGIPCVVGTERATRKIRTGQKITVDASGNEGLVLQGTVPFHITEHDVKKMPQTRTEIMVNVAIPDSAFAASFLPVRGVGLAREEFIIASQIGVHPLAALHFKKLPPVLRRKIHKQMAGWTDPVEYYVDKLAYGIAKIGAAFYPRPVIVRFSDFKTNEYRTLPGGELYEPKEENPMIGWRGASRYYHPDFAPAFALECRALRKARTDMGLTNIIPMIPFCRTSEEGRKVVALMKKHGLDRATDKTLKVYVMCEIPANVILADQFLNIFDGMSIGSNDLTQLTVGIDRDGSALVRGIANENDPSVRQLITEAIQRCRARHKYIGICGQGPSDMPDFAQFLVKQGIESMSLNPDSVVPTLLAVARLEKKIAKSEKRRAKSEKREK